MDHRPPLTEEELHDIGVRNKGNKDAVALLWEIKRLRDENQRDYSIISRCYQIARSLPDQGGVLGLLIADLKQKLEGHPAREYQDSITPDLLKRDLGEKPGDEDE